MQRTKEIGWPPRDMHVSSSQHRAGLLVTAEARHCAYNQTRECFLGLEVSAGEFTYKHLSEMLANQPIRSGEGLWLRPFHGVPATGLYAPLDLIYLDADCRVIETVESFPTFLANPSKPRATSVLVLPAHSIYSSQTQPGDQLVLCVAEEMQWRLENLANDAAESGVVQGAVLLRAEPLWSGGPGLVELEDRSESSSSSQSQPLELTLIGPGTKSIRPPEAWQQRWWSPDPRSAPREHAPGLAAYYWNGTAPKAHSVRDISASGLYVVTEERWYPGTLILMTLERTDAGEEITERSISVLSRAVRWGNDGVGLQFVLNDESGPRRAASPQLEGASRKEFMHFFEQLRRGKNNRIA